MNNKPLAVVILAAGQGTRMKSDLPKVMHELAGWPMIKWLIQSVGALEPKKIICVVGPDMADLKKAVQPHETVVQKTRDGTAGALRMALPKLKGFKGDVLVLLGDAPLISSYTMQELVNTRAQGSKTGIAVLGMELANPFGYGRLIMNREGTLHRIVEQADADYEEQAVQLVNTGAFCIDGARLTRWLDQVGNDNAQGEYYLTDLPAIAAKDRVETRICICPDPEEVMGCNSRSDLATLEMALQKRLRRAVMEDGVTMLDSSSVYLHHDTAIAPGVVIEPHVFFGPDVHVSEGARIKAFSHIEGTNIGKNASIGPFARLRPGSDIEEDVRIGNFVETKNSTIGARSKVGHLAYVGDCEMGDDVNFSAGAITVNYDGFEKHKTIIGKGVMIGSNANLVAPLQVDDGAFIAAGSTVTEDVPADSLSIARDTAEIRKGWAAKYRKRKLALVKKMKAKKKAG